MKSLNERRDFDRSSFQKGIWRVTDVANFLNCSVGHIYNLVSDEKIPKRKKGGLLVFIPHEIYDWILEGDKREKTKVKI